MLERLTLAHVVSLLAEPFRCRLPPCAASAGAGGSWPGEDRKTWRVVLRVERRGCRRRRLGCERASEWDRKLDRLVEVLERKVEANSDTVLIPELQKRRRFTRRYGSLDLRLQEFGMVRAYPELDRLLQLFGGYENS